MRKKQKLLVGLASLTLFDISLATAADLPLKAPPPVAAPVSWAGFYVGAHAGYRWADSSFTGLPYFFDAPFAGRSESFQANSGIFGAQAGYNFLLSPGVLAGIEGDWSWGSGKSTRIGRVNTNSDAFTFRGTSELKLGWQATIRGRLGVVNGPWLFYATGGVAFLQMKWTDSGIDLDSNTVMVSSSVRKTLVGFAVGGGVEYMLTSNWTARVEYLYENFGTVDVPQGLGPQIGKFDFDDIHKVRFAINYKFTNY
jgi:opacity protein-like surface antigen